MFEEKVNARTDGRTTDNGPWHKLAGLRPVELKIVDFTWKGRNLVGKGQNAGYQHFLPYPECFQKLSYPGSLKVRIV